MSALPLLTTDQMASFVARGFLRLDRVIPSDINAQAMDELPGLFRNWLDEFRGVVAGDQFSMHVAWRDSSADGNTVEIGVEQAQYGKAAGDYRASLAFIESRTSAIRRALKGE